MLRLYNSLTRKIEDFAPLKGNEARVYTCGPTVYDYAHIGNLRTYIFEDVLGRVLEMNGLDLKHVMNITDVGHLAADSDTGEEKIEAAARRAGKSSWEIAEFYTKAFLSDMEKLNIRAPYAMPRATDHIAEQIEIIKILESRGFVYKTSDGLYFDTSRFPSYGALSGQKLEEKEEGARVLINPEKRNPWDFALWKFSPSDHKREMEWESPWGVGFPGWHIECSAMSRKYLGQPFDIHAGGVDHVSVHHANEIAQSEAAYGVPLAKYWLHGEFLTVGGLRMGKSEGNLITISEIEKKGFDALAYRYFVFGAHYRSKLNFTWEALAAAQHALWNLEDLVREWPAPKIGCAEFERRFKSALDDDLNMPQALAILWELVKSDNPPEAKAKTLLWFDTVLGLNLEKYISQSLEVPQDIKELAVNRERARFDKDWSLADDLRQKIEKSGYLLEDTAEGVKIKMKRHLK